MKAIRNSVNQGINLVNEGLFAVAEQERINRTLYEYLLLGVSPLVPQHFEEANSTLRSLHCSSSK
jgi:hypothetical protein